MIWIGILLAAVSVFVIFTAAMRDSRSMPRGHQKVTDEEFLAAVPFATPEKALRIRAIISDQLDVPLHDLHPNDRFVEDLRAD